ncbi:hypothetical protein [Streptomyces salyersiae]|uniref:Uncharacterized protein n=1 Tax=Streptomyces salyersiae TaxID=3075530 RepID=A0ABU2RQZ9_9ACTN|nr:hypothetical protein [Streptomyces sp. DSM 41770]MDT0431272.1 hypothetical protein [Streptomyces sp. DSM 41770]
MAAHDLLRAGLDRLRQVVREALEGGGRPPLSHLACEEGELVEPMARLGAGW